MFGDLKILVVGDICLDIIEEGRADRLSPEAPVPVVLNPTKKYSLGMMGNVLLNVANLGAEVEFITNFYGDKYGNKILELLDNEGLCNIESEYVKKNKQTIVKKRIFANGHQIARIDKEEKNSPNLKIVEKKLSNFAESSRKFDAIIISDYNKGLITKDFMYLLKAYLPLIAKDNVHFYVDTKKKSFAELFNGKDYTIFPNTKELEEMNDKDTVSVNIVETMSEKGARYFNINGDYYHSKALASDVVDVCGCGDTFIAAFALYDTKFGNKQRALDFANYCCSKVVQKKGTIPINYQEVIGFEKL